MKKTWALIAIALLLLVSACSNGTSSQNANGSGKKYKIGISQIAQHPALDGAREGFIKALKDNGFEDGKNIEIDYQNASGDPSTNNTIAQKFVSDNKDLVLGVSTNSTQALLQNTKKIPILFVAVSDPVGSKLVKDLKKPGGNVTGYSDTPDGAIQNTVQSMKDFFPNAKTVGIIYNSGETNSVASVKKAKEVMASLSLNAKEATVTNTNEVKTAAESLVGKVDLLYVPQDNTAVSAIQSIISVANKNKIPLFVGEKESVKSGGFAGMGFEYTDLGYSTGLMAVKILKGQAKPADLPVGFPEKLQLVLNSDAAAAQGIDVNKLPKTALDKWKPTWIKNTN